MLTPKVPHLQSLFRAKLYFTFFFFLFSLESQISTFISGNETEGIRPFAVSFLQHFGVLLAASKNLATRCIGRQRSCAFFPVVATNEKQKMFVFLLCL